MRINQFIASATGMSRRKADEAISSGRVNINEQVASLGQNVGEHEVVRLDGSIINISNNIPTTIILNKPVGYICSRNGQGSPTIYDLLPDRYNELKIAGRLDKDSSGLVLVTNDGNLINKLTHPKHQKTKTYLVALNKKLSDRDKSVITDKGVMLEDGISKFEISEISSEASRMFYRNSISVVQSSHRRYETLLREYMGKRLQYEIKMSEGRNRQVRRTFEALGYQVTTLHRIALGEYILDDLETGKYKVY